MLVRELEIIELASRENELGYLEENMTVESISFGLSLILILASVQWIFTRLLEV